MEKNHEHTLTRNIIPIIVTMILLPVTTLAVAEDAGSVVEAISLGKTKLSFRARFEGVDQDGFSKDASASTLRTRLAFESATYNGWHLGLEMDDLSQIGADDYNSLRNGNSSRPVVADPTGTDLNQAYIGFKNPSNVIKLGRQRINLDNERFVGGVGWRQNEQTFDALLIQNQSLKNMTFSYAYVDRVMRIFGPDDGTPAAALDTESHIINIGRSLGNLGNLTGYGYFLDIDKATAVSSRTLGLRFKGTRPFGNNHKLHYTFEYATQDDWGSNQTDYSADYYTVEIGVNLPNFSVKTGVEVLEGNDGAQGEAFTTPLATLHKFQGFADKFLTTPDAGIEDSYVGLSFVPLGTKVGITYHRFDAESGNANYGTELDLTALRKINEHFSLLLKYSDYSADDYSKDTKKLWVMLSANF